MKLSFKWLNDFIKHGLAPEKLAERLTMAGQEVKGIERVGDDRVFEIEITPNRPDCLSVLGLAREVSAIVNKPLLAQKFKFPLIPKKKCDITIEDRSACSRYIGAIIDGASLQESAPSVKERLRVMGSRSINNIVDVTNYLLFEQGQPMHAFDFDQLIGGKIIVRKAKSGEKIITLDGVERALNPNILVIADEKRPVAIAGIMGGAATEVTAKTKRILLECAYFDPGTIRRAGRALGLTSDSAYRFERGIDCLKMDSVIKRALNMILQSAGGTIVEYRDIHFRKTNLMKSFHIDVDEFGKFLGYKVTSSDIKKILNKLEFKVSGKGGKLSVTAPSFRTDMKATVDVAEEIARIIGYDRLPSSLPHIKPSAIVSSGSYQLNKKLRQVLVGQGLSEVITYPLVSRSAIERSYVTNHNLLRIKNPLSLDQEFMRPSLISSMLSAVFLNLNRGQKNICFFEFGKIYNTAGEKEVLGIIFSGTPEQHWRRNKKESLDFYHLKGVLTCVLECGGQQPDYAVSKRGIYTPGQAAEILVEGTTIGSFGLLNKTVIKNWDLKRDDIYFAEMDLGSFSSEKLENKNFVPLNEYPSITRDISLAVKREIPFADIKAIVQQNGKTLLRAIHFREQYLGEKIAPEQKGVVFSLQYQASDRTLTEAEIVPIHDRILQALTKELSAIIR